MIRSSRSRADRRRGVTLIEMTVMMTAVAAMLGACALMLGLAMRLQSDGVASFERSESLDRLAVRFRDDAHAARSATIDGRALRLEPSAGKVVEYRVDEEGGLSRVVVEGEKETAREPYRIPEAVAARLALRDEDGRRFAALAVDLQRRRDRIDPIRTWEVVAVVGRNLPPKPKEGGRP
jgi:hypothetical protein